jgi:exopolysaccharide biosynthesis polyprenyl glycosylphosphotransferase
MSIAVEGTALDHRPTAGVDDLRDERAGLTERAGVPWRRLAVADLAVIVGAWALAATAFSGSLADVAPIVAAALVLIAWRRLYAPGIADMRVAELRGVLRVSLQLVAVAQAVTWLLHGRVSWVVVGVGSALSLAGLLLSRVLYRAWLRAARASGRFCRPLVLVGIDEHTQNTRQRLEERPELGFTVVAAFGSRQAAYRFGLGDVWADGADEAPASAACRTAEATVVSTTALRPDTIDPIVRRLLEAARGEVYFSTGTTVVDHSRLQPVNLDYEPVLRVYRPRRGRMQLLAKRAIDLAVGVVALVLALPLLAVGAAAIKLGDGGPVLFRQVRVGEGGRLFTVYKLRTMAVDAETRLAHLRDHNERSGPLFKMEHDPRVTRVGAFMRDLSIDELPQLWNVLKGDMSLVGPRPALPHEVELFDDQLSQRRCQVRPGITGLWQVEARDNPCFVTYERLDLFYVENWSVILDLTILVATVEDALARVGKHLFQRRPQDARRSRLRQPARLEALVEPSPIRRIRRPLLSRSNADT